jgi:hypothetical protein
MWRKLPNLRARCHHALRHFINGGAPWRMSSLLKMWRKMPNLRAQDAIMRYEISSF